MQNGKQRKKSSDLRFFPIFANFVIMANSLWASVIINMTKNCEKSQLLNAKNRQTRFFTTHTKKSLFVAAACKPGRKWSKLGPHFFFAWENSRHFTRRPRNEVSETSPEIPCWWNVTTQIWVVTRHQYRISALFSQTSFRGRRVKCRLFCHAGLRLKKN